MRTIKAISIVLIILFTQGIMAQGQVKKVEEKAIKVETKVTQEEVKEVRKEVKSNEQMMKEKMSVQDKAGGQHDDGKTRGVHEDKQGHEGHKHTQGDGHNHGKADAHKHEAGDGHDHGQHKGNAHGHDKGDKVDGESSEERPKDTRTKRELPPSLKDRRKWIVVSKTENSV
jgi:hypothetical protein